MDLFNLDPRWSDDPRDDSRDEVPVAYWPVEVPSVHSHSADGRYACRKHHRSAANGDRGSRVHRHPSEHCRRTTRRE